MDVYNIELSYVQLTTLCLLIERLLCFVSSFDNYK